MDEKVAVATSLNDLDSGSPQVILALKMSSTNNPGYLARSKEENGVRGSNLVSTRLSYASTLVEGHFDTPAPHIMFEGRQFFDPHATWSAEEERKVKRKCDIRLLSWLCIMYLGKSDSTFFFGYR